MRTTLNCVNHSNKIQNSGEAHKQPLIHFQTTLDGHFMLKPGSCSHAKKKKELFLSQKPLVFLNDTQTFKLQTYTVEFNQHFAIGCQTEFIPYSQP